jgi:hypothetical protein
MFPSEVVSMAVLGVVVRIGIFWAISVLVAVGAMELGHRIVAAMDREAAVTRETRSAVSVAGDRVR